MVPITEIKTTTCETSLIPEEEEVEITPQKLIKIFNVGSKATFYQRWEQGQEPWVTIPKGEGIDVVKLPFPPPRRKMKGLQETRMYGEVHALTLALYFLLGGKSQPKPLTLEELGERIKESKGVQIEVTRNQESGEIEKITILTKPPSHKIVTPTGKVVTLTDRVVTLTISPDLGNQDVQFLCDILNSLCNRFGTETSDGTKILGSIE